MDQRNRKNLQEGIWNWLPSTVELPIHRCVVASTELVAFDDIVKKETALLESTKKYGVKDEAKKGKSKTIH